jgi:hypothetical protein
VRKTKAPTEAGAKVGGAFALAAIVLYVGRLAGVGFFVELNSSIYQGIEIAGLVGACMVAVELIIAAGKGLRWIARKLSAAITRRAALADTEPIHKNRTRNNRQTLVLGGHASSAVIENLADVRRHPFYRSMSAVRTSDNGH